MYVCEWRASLFHKALEDWILFVRATTCIRRSGGREPMMEEWLQNTLGYTLKRTRLWEACAMLVVVVQATSQGLASWTYFKALCQGFCVIVLARK